MNNSIIILFYSLPDGYYTVIIIISNHYRSLLCAIPMIIMVCQRNCDDVYYMCYLRKWVNDSVSWGVFYALKTLLLYGKQSHDKHSHMPKQGWTLAHRKHWIHSVSSLCSLLILVIRDRRMPIFYGKICHLHAMSDLQQIRLLFDWTKRKKWELESPFAKGTE